MKPKAPQIEKDPGKQTKAFEQQPPKAKELELMKDQAEKSTGKERVEVNEKIRTKAGS